jgi:hypothetical protein
MADDNILRSYRSNDAARRASAPAESREIGGSDPLAELARLIGQSDPFADLERSGGQPAEARPRPEFAPSDWRSTAAAMAREAMRNPPAPEPHFEQVDSAIAAAKSLRASPEDQFAEPGYHAAPRLASHAAFDQPALPQDDFADNAYGDGPRKRELLLRWRDGAGRRSLL